MMRPLCLALAAVVSMAFVSAPSARAVTSNLLINPVSGKCLDVTSGSAVILTCAGNTNQLWTSTAANELRVGAKCLDAAGSANGTRAVIAACDGRESQQWTLNQDQ